MTRIAMSFPISARKGLFVAALLMGLQLPALAQSSYTKQGSEYDLVGAIAGDQVNPAVSFNAQGGYLTWDDNSTAEGGRRIGGRRLNQNLSGTFEVFQVNQAATGVHERPKVAMLADGGAVFVWQGGAQGFSKIYARFMNASGAFITGDIQVNTHTGGEKEWPVVTTLKDGSVVVVWESSNQDDASNADAGLRVQRGLYARKFSSTGAPLSGEVLVNQAVIRNQRSPSVTALPNGGFAVAWVSEALRGIIANNPESSGSSEGTSSVIQDFSVDVVARVFNAEAQPSTGEFVVDDATIKTGAPQIKASADGVIYVTWMQYRGFGGSSYDVLYRQISAQGQLLTTPIQVNQYSHGDQAFPQLAFSGDDSMVVWVSYNQDNNGMEVYGRLISGAGGFSGSEFRVNTALQNNQLTPVVASDNDGRFLAVWSSYYAGRSGYDLYAQRYSGGVTLPAPDAPYASALSQTRISLTWPVFAGLDIAEYLVYLGDNTSPVSVTVNSYTISGLTADTTYTYRLAYKLTDGRTSPKSEPITAKTWGYDENFDGLPDDWQLAYWGTNPWPPSNFDNDQDGASNFQEFLAGTDPLNADSVLRTRIVAGLGGSRLEWNTVPGSLYRVQLSTNFNDWENVGDLRFSPGQTDSVPLSTAGTMVIYRVIRIR